MNEFHFDNTILKDFAECEAAAIAKHVFGLRGKANKVAADIGNVFHAALELYFQGKARAQIMERFAEEYDKVVPPGQQPEEDRFARGNVTKIMEQYLRVRPLAQMPFEAVSFEQVRGTLLHRDSEGELIFWVKRDMVGKDRQTGLLVPVDHKTTGRLTTWWSRKFRLASQLSGYCWFTEQEYKQPVPFCYVNGIQVGKLPDSLTKCKVHSTPGKPVKYIECSQEHAEFQMYQYSRSAAQIEKWRLDAISIATKARLLSRAFSDIRTLQFALRQGAFNESCMFCEHKDWCREGFKPEGAEVYAVYSPWRVWEHAGAGRIDI